MKIRVNLNPVPASRPRVSKFGTYYMKRYEQFRKDIKEFGNSLSCVPKNSLLKASVELFIQIPRSYSRKRKKSLHLTYCDNNSDIDNYAKSVLDGFNGVLYEDDRQIADLNIKKIWIDGEGYFTVDVKEVVEFNNQNL